MLSEGKRHEELVKAGLVVKENEVLSFLLFLKALDPCTVFYSRISAEENSERMAYDGMSRLSPFFLFIILFLICHIHLQSYALVRIQSAFFFIVQREP